MRFRLLLMIAVTLLDVAFCTAKLHGAQPPNFVPDFRAGMAGDPAALDRAMKTTEDLLATDPKNAKAEVWHGAGLIYRSGKLFRDGDYEAGSHLFEQGVQQMNDAVSLAPGDPMVLIPRGASLLAATLFMSPDDESKALLRSGLDNYLKALEKVDGPVRGRVLFGIADAYYRLGDQTQAATYFQRVSTEAKGTGWQRQADRWLSQKSLTQQEEMCADCDESK